MFALILGNLEIGNGAGLVAADLDGVYHEICSAKGVLAVEYAEILGDPGTAIVDVFIERVDHDVGLLQTLLVDVVQGYLKIAERFTAHGVAQDILGKYGAARTHECNLSHCQFLTRSE